MTYSDKLGIEIFYNQEKRHSQLNYDSPLLFEQSYVNVTYRCVHLFGGRSALDITQLLPGLQYFMINVTNGRGIALIGKRMWLL
jgi:hypothetical protein